MPPGVEDSPARRAVYRTTVTLSPISLIQRRSGSGTRVPTAALGALPAPTLLSPAFILDLALFALAPPLFSREPQLLTRNPPARKTVQQGGPSMAPQHAHAHTHKHKG